MFTTVDREQTLRSVSSGLQSNGQRGSLVLFDAVQGAPTRYIQ